MKKIATLFLVLGMMTLVFAGCSNQEAEEGQEKVYAIATDVAFAPFEFEVDGAYTGIDIDLLNAIAEAEGFAFELKPMNFNGIIPALTAGQVDGAIAGMSITEERKEVLDFSDPYYESGVTAVIHIDNEEINGIEDFEGKTFAVKKGTAGSFYAESIKDTYNNDLRYFDDSASMFQEVMNGNADVAFEDYPVIAYKISLDEEPQLKLIGDKESLNYYGFGVKKGENQELLEKFNAGLEKLIASGAYEEILNKYE